MPPECRLCGRLAYADDFLGHEPGCRTPLFSLVFMMLVRGLTGA
jgi:hypothetical protein